MKPLIASVAILAVGVVVVSGLFQLRQSELRAAEDAELQQKLQADLKQHASVAEDPAVSESNLLREQLLKRLKQKVDLMSDEELKQAIQSTDGEIRELEVARRMDAVEETLEGILRDYPRTRLAPVVGQMLSLYRNPDATDVLPSFASPSRPSPARPTPIVDDFPAPQREPNLPAQ